ncbi:HAD family phosphatase, partial [Rhodopseudomonas sp. B29]|uniref:HAD family hydrolase n=1 Tax=Rhodopseudomonas sp. B29 TaxID=95607 RepID=UPI0003B6234D
CNLIIFDCDGVLVDSEPISCRVHAEVLTRRGYPITTEQVAMRFLGRSGRQTRHEIEDELGRGLGDDFEAELHAELIAAFEASLQPVPFITDALDRIDQPVCVASSGTLARIAAALTCARLIDRLAPNLFSAEQVVHGKPAPDLFLLAAGRMGVAPAACVVIEDSEPGVLAARAAGMPVLGFTGGSHCGPETAERLRRAGAAAIFADMRQLPDFLSELPAL